MKLSLRGEYAIRALLVLSQNFEEPLVRIQTISVRHFSGVMVAHLRLLLGLALVLPCGGCLVGPDFSRPSAPVAEKWLEADNSSVDTRNQEYRDWWSVFHDPVLNRLIEIAYNQNLTLVSVGYTRVWRKLLQAMT